MIPTHGDRSGPARMRMTGHMASKKTSEEKPGRKTQKLNVWLSPEQIAWLKTDKAGASVAVRALITEAMNMQNLAKSLKSGKKKRK
jgi:hypothetical protein